MTFLPKEPCQEKMNDSPPGWFTALTAIRANLRAAVTEEMADSMISQKQQLKPSSKPECCVQDGTNIEKPKHFAKPECCVQDGANIEDPFLRHALFFRDKEEKERKKAALKEQSNPSSKAQMTIFESNRNLRVSSPLKRCVEDGAFTTKTKHFKQFENDMKNEEEPIAKDENIKGDSKILITSSEKPSHSITDIIMQILDEMQSQIECLDWRLQNETNQRQIETTEI